LPPVELLNPFKKQKHSQDNIKHNCDVIERTLESFGIRAKVVDVLIGPSVTQFALDLTLGIKVSKIVNLTKDLALSLAIPANSIRLETPIAGTTYIGIEVPNEFRETVYLKEAMADPQLKEQKLNLPAALGKDIHGNMQVIDLQKMPHILIAGATGSGKSILTNGFIISLLMTRTPDEVKFIMIDPKQVELSDYNGIPHLLTPVITEMDKVLNALKWAIAEMENRYTLFRESHVKNIEGYNQLMGYYALFYIVIVIDEMADMMMSTNRVETESAIVRLAQKARATGIHLVLATQRPSVDVITGLIKANIPGRIGMSVTTNIDSRVILDQIGAESLLGKGDMLFKDPSKNKPFRIQGIWVSPEEVQKVVQHIKNQVPEVTYTTKVTEFKDKKEEAAAATAAAGENAENSGDTQDLMDAIRVVVNSQKGSSSLLQRKLRFGYNKAARIIDELEEYGLIGPANGSKPRDVYSTDAEAFIAKIFNNGGNVSQASADTLLNNADSIYQMSPKNQLDDPLEDNS
jgi:S-DNA-T family DNA segregation ATPase FtsK/SpoIIIE